LTNAEKIDGTPQGSDSGSTLIKLVEDERRFLDGELDQLRKFFASNVVHPLAGALMHGAWVAPLSIEQFLQRLNSAKKASEGERRSGEFTLIDEGHAPVIKLALFVLRRIRAASVDERKARTNGYSFA
jgi:hypothetical protein